MDNNKLYKLAQQVLKSRTQGTGMNQTTKSIVEIKKPEGTRYYEGRGMGGGSLGKSQAQQNALWKSKNNAADSVTTNYMKNFKGDR